MNNRLKKTSVWMPLAIALSLVAGMWIGHTFFNGSGKWSSRSKLDTILELVDRSYVDDVDTHSRVCFHGLTLILSIFLQRICRMSMRSLADHFPA